MTWRVTNRVFEAIRADNFPQRRPWRDVRARAFITTQLGAHRGNRPALGGGVILPTVVTTEGSRRTSWLLLRYCMRVRISGPAGPV